MWKQEISWSLFRSENQHRHGQASLGKAGEILRVLLERAKVFEAGAHAARPAISFRVNLAVALRHRMFGVGGKIVPEMLKIDAFAAVYQRERGLAVEMAMPEVPHQPHVAPVSYARQEGIH